MVNFLHVKLNQIGSDEIWEYIKEVVEEYGADKMITFNARVVSATWHDDKAKWEVTTDINGELKTETCDVFVNGQGFLNRPKLPDIEGSKGRNLFAVNFSQL